MTRFITVALTLLGFVELVLLHVALIAVSLFCIAFFGQGAYDQGKVFYERIRGKKSEFRRSAA